MPANRDAPAARPADPGFRLQAAARTDLGRQLLNAGDVDRARAEFEAALRLDPDDAQAWSGLGVCLERRREYNRAVAAFGEAIGRSARPSKHLAHRAEVYRLMGQLRPAEADLDEAIREDPANGYLFRARGRIRAELHDLRPALIDLDEAVRLAPRDQAAYAIRAEVHERLNDRSSAERDRLRVRAIRDGVSP